MDLILCCCKSVLKYVGKKYLCNCSIYLPIWIIVESKNLFVQIVALQFMSLIFFFNYIIHLESLAAFIGPGFPVYKEKWASSLTASCLHLSIIPCPGFRWDSVNGMWMFGWCWMMRVYLGPGHSMGKNHSLYEEAAEDREELGQLAWFWHGKAMKL